jgi:8-oxo-dGTP diphosphatase
MSLAARPAAGLVAASCHDAEQLAHAIRLELDFAVLGPVKPTASHPGAAPMGWSRFAELARGASIPVYAIGGMSSVDLYDAWRAGAHGVAMIRSAWG